MADKEEKPPPHLEGILVNPPKVRPTSRRERVMLREVDDVKQLDRNDVVSFYTADNTLRYYVRLLDPPNRKGVAVFHFNRKGRPSYRFMPSYQIPPNTKCALIYKRELSGQILELLFRQVTFSPSVNPPANTDTDK